VIFLAVHKGYFPALQNSTEIMQLIDCRHQIERVAAYPDNPKKTAFEPRGRQIIKKIKTPGMNSAAYPLGDTLLERSCRLPGIVGALGG
jgi:hypothetical protein